jgi:hypothetical protein
MFRVPVARTAMLGVFAAGALALLGSARAQVADCAALSGLTIPASSIGLPTGGAVVTSASLVATPVANCQVNGRIDPVDPTAPPINFRVNLPSDWNGKAFQFGGGGFDGSVVSATGSIPSAPPGTPGPLARGYTTMGSDSGHSGGNASFALNDEALVNFGYAQLKKTKDVAVALMQAYYQASPWRVYFAGSSQGGREAVTVAQRFPDDYDGVFSRVPVLNFTALQVAGNRMGAPTLGSSGGWMNPAKRTLLTNATFAACDALDGVADNLIARYEGCHFDPSTLRCAGGADTGDDCLSDAQINAVRTLHSPLTFDYPLAKGVTSYPGWPTGHEAASWGTWTMGAAPPPAVQPSGPSPGGALIVNFGAQTIRYFIAKDPTLQTYSFDHNSPLWRDRIQQVSAIVDSTDPNLAAFAVHGGKLIIQEHFGDYAQSPFAGVNYYKSVVATLGKPATDSFTRLYVSPGAEHGGANAPSQVDMITVLENWVEHGIAPGNLVQTQPSPARSLPMCRYPAWPQYVFGNALDASSFACTLAATIDIKPGDSANTINSRSAGATPVAILSSLLFDAPNEVETNSLTFGRTGDEASLRFCNPHGEDVNGDGQLDLVCHFDTRKAGFVAGDTEGILKGLALGPNALIGSASVRIVG